MLRSLLFYITLFLATVICSLLAICTAFVSGGGNGSHLIGRFWSRIMLFTAGVKVQVQGLDNINPKEAYVFAANHQSQFDIFTLFGYLPTQFRWLAKKELFRIPIFGAAMKTAGYISIDRTNRKEAFKSIDLAATKVREGTSVVIFPEGTRSLDGKLQPFKKGGFHLAIKSKRPIVPVSISGAFSILPKKGFRVRPQLVRVYIGEPLPTKDITAQHRDWLISETRRRIQEKLPTEEKGQPEPVRSHPFITDAEVS